MIQSDGSRALNRINLGMTPIPKPFTRNTRVATIHVSQWEIPGTTYMFQGTTKAILVDSSIGGPEAASIGRGGVVGNLMHEEFPKSLLNFRCLAFLGR